MPKTMSGHPLGLHRVLDEPKVLPQNARRLDPKLPLCRNEILVAVQHLQIDSASFAQLKRKCRHEKTLAREIRAIVRKRGKMQNPVTGSGGMLLGTVAKIGPDYPDKSLKPGQKIATLVSLTATPLKLERVLSVAVPKERVTVKGHAILFEKSLYAVMPDDLSPGAALAAFDVCGAPLLAVNHVKVGDRVLVMGLGKAGLSVVAAVCQEFGDRVAVAGVDAREAAVSFCRDTYGGRSVFFAMDAGDPVSLMDKIAAFWRGQLATVTVNCVNSDNTEMPAILATQDGGQCIFFGMNTSFQKAALGCESVGKDVELIMGRGYTKGHALFMLGLLRRDAALRGYFEKEFGGE